MVDCSHACTLVQQLQLSLHGRGNNESNVRSLVCGEQG